MKALIVTGIVISIATLFSCNNTPVNFSEHADGHKDSVLIASHSFKTSDGWGYIITVGDKIVIKQSMIPVVQGIKSFATEEDALKTASIVVNKIKLHQKPTLFRSELQKIGIVE
jgi:hypothetical protein